MTTTGEILRRARAQAPRGAQRIGFNGNTGAFTFGFGRGKTPIPEAQKLIVVIDRTTCGCMLWKNGKVTERRVVNSILDDDPTPRVPANEPRIGQLAPPRDRDGWTPVMTLRCVGFKGPLDKVAFDWEATAGGQIGAMDEHMKAAIAQTETPDGERGFYNPIVTVGSEHYRSPNHGNIVYVPVFKILGWTDGRTAIPK